MGMRYKYRPQRRNNFSGFLLFLFFMIAIPYGLINRLSGISRSIRYSSKPAVAVQNSYEKGPLADAAGVLTSAKRAQLTEFLTELSKNTGVQIGVVTVNSLGEKTIEEFSLAVAEKWKLGQRGKDNGALLVVAMEEHEVRIETGYGTEGVLTDAKCARIIRNIIVPAFKQGEYGEGIFSAVKTMAGIITSDESLVSPGYKSTGTAQHRRQQETESPLGLLIPFIIMILLVSNRWIPWWAFFIPGGHHYHYRSFGSGGNFTSGGSSFSGGGGSFGGGGASGKW